MVNNDTPLSRGSIEQIAGSLRELVETAPDSRQRRQLADCAARLQAVARTIQQELPVPIGRSAQILDAAKAAGERMGQMQRSSVLLLGLLLVTPGATCASRDLATAIGISPQSVRVFAFHLRKWLADAGYPDALRSQWGTGYMLARPAALALLAAEPALAHLVRQIGVGEPAELTRAA